MTTSPKPPAIDARRAEDMLAFIRAEWEHYTYQIFLCPNDVFATLIHTNYIRSLQPGSSLVASWLLGPNEVLDSIIRFSPEEWSGTQADLRDQWRPVAQMYQSSAILYCIYSLAPHFQPPLDLKALRDTHRSRLVGLLQRAGDSVRMLRGCVWPVIVAGVEAAPGDFQARVVVRNLLNKLSNILATSLMLEAKDVLEAYWRTGEVGFDACFSRPYAFVV